MRANPAKATQQAFLFADLAGYTALTEAHGDAGAVEAVVEFTRRVETLLPSPYAQIVKTIGDAVMVRLAEPADAVRLGLDIAHTIGQMKSFPVVRVGIHYGPALEMREEDQPEGEGDWIGAAVNLAARVVGLAGGGEVLITDEVRVAAKSLDRVVFLPRGPQRLKNIARPIDLYLALDTDRAEQRPIVDPVCRMTVNPDQAAGPVSHAGSAYFFCSEECQQAFSQDPSSYVEHLQDAPK